MFDNFTNCLAMKVYEAFNEERPFEVCTIAAAAGQEAVAKWASTATLNRSMKWMESMTSRLLEDTNLCGDYYDRLQNIHLQRKRLLATIHDELEHGHFSASGPADFGKKCEPKRSGPRIGGCPSYATVGGSFRTLRRQAAQVMMDRLRETSKLTAETSGLHPIRLLLENQIDCLSCRHRLSFSFSGVIVRKHDAMNQSMSI